MVRLILSVNILACFLTVGIMLHAGQLIQDFAWLKLFGLVFFGLWALSPYLVLSLLAKKEKNPKKLVVNLAVTLFLVIAGLWIYYDGFYVHTDAQNGLLFLFIPLYQLCFVGASVAIGAFFKAN